MLAPGDLIDADVDQPAQQVGVQLLGHDARTHRPDGAPRNTAERRHRLLVTLAGQPDHKVLEVAGEPRSRPRERHRLGQDTVLGAAQPTSPQPEHTYPPAQVQVPPCRTHRLIQSASAQHDRLDKLHNLRRVVVACGTHFGLSRSATTTCHALKLGETRRVLLIFTGINTISGRDAPRTPPQRRAK